MIRIDLFLLGCFRFKIQLQDISRAATALLKSNLSADIKSDGEFYVPFYQKKKYVSALGSIKFEVSEILGLPRTICKLKGRYGIIAAFAFLLAFYAFSYSFVWDIRIEGTENLSPAAVEEELYRAGFFTGKAWRKISLDKVEGELLADSDDVGWININRKGTVAYVKVREKSVAENEKTEEGYSNIVAGVDCVIEEITVKSGIAMVKQGDTVKAGQLLISGVIPVEYGGGFVDADGEIWGRVTDELSVKVLREETTYKYENEVLSEGFLNILNFSVKFFKSYRNVADDYVIIEDNERCVVLGKRLPIGTTRIYKQIKTEKEVTRSDKELVDVASSRLSALRVMTFSDAHILRMSTSGEFTDDGYRMTSKVSALRQIGEKKYF